MVEESVVFVVADGLLRVEALPKVEPHQEVEESLPVVVRNPNPLAAVVLSLSLPVVVRNPNPLAAVGLSLSLPVVVGHPSLLAAVGRSRARPGVVGDTALM